MKRLHFSKPNNLSALHDELMQTLPDLRPAPNDRGVVVPRVRVEGVGSDVWVEVDEGIDSGAVESVVRAHKADVGTQEPHPLSQLDDAAIEAADTPAKTRAVLKTLVSYLRSTAGV